MEGTPSSGTQVTGLEQVGPPGERSGWDRDHVHRAGGPWCKGSAASQRLERGPRRGLQEVRSQKEGRSEMRRRPRAVNGADSVDRSTGAAGNRPPTSLARTRTRPQFGGCSSSSVRGAGLSPAGARERTSPGGCSGLPAPRPLAPVQQRPRLPPPGAPAGLAGSRPSGPWKRSPGRPAAWGLGGLWAGPEPLRASGAGHREGPERQ